jgi:hypothetical protein
MHDPDTNPLRFAKDNLFWISCIIFHLQRSDASSSASRLLCGTAPKNIHNINDSVTQFVWVCFKEQFVKKTMHKWLFQFEVFDKKLIFSTGAGWAKISEIINSCGGWAKILKFWTRQGCAKHLSFVVGKKSEMFDRS